jgi:hypothetical protein
VKSQVFERLHALETNVCPFDNLPEAKTARRGEALTAEAMKNYRWVKPKLVAEQPCWPNTDPKLLPLNMKSTSSCRHTARSYGTTLHYASPIRKPLIYFTIAECFP